MPTFNRSPLKWVEFVIKFKDVHNCLPKQFTEATLLTAKCFTNNKEINIRLHQ